MREICTHCGASTPEDLSCRELFDTGQAMEFELAAYGIVHHLSVPAYMLQHDTYTELGWLEARALLDRFVNRGLGPEMARKEFSTNPKSHNWSLTRGPKFAGVEKVAWSMTIADVRMESSEAYCADVRRWAASVLADTESLVYKHR